MAVSPLRTRGRRVLQRTGLYGLVHYTGLIPTPSRGSVCREYERCSRVCSIVVSRVSECASARWLRSRRRRRAIVRMCRWYTTDANTVPSGGICNPVCTSFRFHTRVRRALKPCACLCGVYVAPSTASIETSRLSRCPDGSRRWYAARLSGGRDNVSTVEVAPARVTTYTARCRSVENICVASSTASPGSGNSERPFPV